MARPIQRRVIESIPEYKSFHTDGIPSGCEVVLSTDEFEVIRIIDKNKLSQEEAAKEMGVSRATIASIYQRAREKIALLIVDGRSLTIKGGAFVIKESNKESKTYNEINDKGDEIMRIAVTYDNGRIFQHFGRTEEFKVYDVEDGVIKSSTVINTNGQGHGALIGVLESIGADVLICGGIGGGAQSGVAAMGIELYGGIDGEADEAVKAYLEGKLEQNSNANCNHHQHEESHNCSHGGCGGHCHH